jgi:aryl carrier-like protein
MFADDIAGLYNDIDDNQCANDSGGFQEPLSEFLRKIFAELAEVPITEVNDWTTLYDLNIDSRLSLSLRASLSKRLGAVSLGTIFENPSIEKLVAFFEKKSNAAVAESRVQVINQMISRLTAEFSTWPSRKPSSGHVAPTAETILLTGASGSLGTALLESLTKSSRVKKVYAMIRGPNNTAKLQKSLNSRGLDADSIMRSGKVELLNYSMQDPLLGLDAETYAMLAREVTIVIHNAWKMDFNQGVEYFENDCIRSMLNPPTQPH